MKKILIFLMALVLLAVTTPVFAAKRSIMELPLFERAVLIIKKFETLYKPKHWPTICYGHVVQRGEHFTRRQYSERKADALLRRDYAKFCELYEEYGRDKYLLAALAYNIGPGAVNKSSVLKKLKRGDRNIFKSYTSHCHYKDKWYKGLYNRRLTEIAALYIP